MVKLFQHFLTHTYSLKLIIYTQIDNTDFKMFVQTFNVVRFLPHNLTLKFPFCVYDLKQRLLLQHAHA